MTNPGELIAALLQIREMVERLPADQVSDGVAQASASFNSLTQGMNSPLVAEAQQKFREASTRSTEAFTLVAELHEVINNTILIF